MKKSSVREFKLSFMLGFILLLFSATALANCNVIKSLSSNDMTASTKLNKIGSKQYRENRFDEAFETFQLAAERFPNDYRAWNNLAVLLSEVHKDYPKSIEYFEKSICLNPNFYSSRISFGTAYYYLGKFDDASRQLEKAIELNADSITARSNLALVYIKLRRYKHAVKILTDGRRSIPNDAIYLNNLAAGYLYCKKYTQAIQYFEHIVTMEPQNTMYRFNLGIAYLQGDKKEKAIAQMKIIQNIDTSRAELLYQGIYSDKILFLQDGELKK